MILIFYCIYLLLCGDIEFDPGSANLVKAFNTTEEVEIIYLAEIYLSSHT